MMGIRGREGIRKQQPAENASGERTQPWSWDIFFWQVGFTVSLPSWFEQHTVKSSWK
jgi:hypothetical protein